MVHRDTLKNPNNNRKYDFGDSSGEDDGELSDENAKGAKYKPSGYFDDSKYLRGTQVMGAVLNEDQNKSVAANKQELIQKKKEEENRIALEKREQAEALEREK